MVNQKLKRMIKTLFVTNHIGLKKAQQHFASEGLKDTVDVFQLKDVDALPRKIRNNDYQLVIIDGKLGPLYTESLHEKVLEKCKRQSSVLGCVNINLVMKDIIFLGLKYEDSIRGYGVFHRDLAA